MTSSFGTSLDDGPLGNLAALRPGAEDPHFDITAMIDLVFMMNIYFLVTFVSTVAAEVALPSANNARALDAEKAVTITILNGTSWQTVQVFIGDGKEGTPITDPEEQAKAVDAAVKQGVASGKTAVLVKAEQSVRLGELRRVCDAVDEQGVTLHLAVLEKDEKK